MQFPRRAKRAHPLAYAKGCWIYLVSAAIALYLNVFVLVIQAFLKIPALHALAPNGNEPPFAVVQAITLVLFVIGGFLAVRRYRPVAG